MANLKTSNSSGHTAINSGDEHSLPLLGEDENDMEHSRRICIYLHNLQDRLKLGVQQHTDLIQKSVRLLKEVNDVSATLALAKSGSNLQKTKIKRLIMEFENGSAKSGEGLDELVELRGLLTDFERLNDNQLLHESLLNFKRAGDSFEKVQNFLESVGCGANVSPNPSPQPSQILPHQNTNRSLRERIEAFNKALEVGKNASQDFVKCFSSHCSLENVLRFPSDVKLQHVGSRTNSGYEGDVDSEIDTTDNEASLEK